MARGLVNVTFGSEDGSRIPDNLTAGAALLLDLQRRGVLATLGARLQIRRQGGFCGLDVWVVLFLFFTTGATSGFKAFWEGLRPHALRLAALAGRTKLASPPSLSRALEAVEPALPQTVGDWLLGAIADDGPILRHPAVQTYDAVGRGWHVFDVDPTVRAVRHRALPVGEDLPRLLRRSEEMGKPGYKGRKRGDIVFRRATAQHAGSGLWVHAHLSEGTGDSVADFERCLDSIAATCDRLEHPRDHALVRMDGEHGNVPWYSACRARSLPFVTRINRPVLYEDPHVQARLRAATWHEVPDSGCEPLRAAADLGIMTISPGKKTLRPDGGTYEPVTLRVVASIFPKTGDAKRGRTIDGWQVELFAVDLPGDAWPAPEAIAAYYGRNAIENRFAQEDRELGLDRIVSYHLPGQELATLVGLSLWNLRIVRGFELAPPPADRPTQTARRARVDRRVPSGWPGLPAESSRDRELVQILGELNWPSLLAGHDDWRFDAEKGEIVCADGRVLTLTSVRPAGRRATSGIIFRRPWGGCANCHARETCLHSEREDASKHVQFAVPVEIAARLGARLKQARPPAPERARIAEAPSAPGRHAVHDTLFLPARARQTFAATFRGATLHVDVDLPPRARRPNLLAADVSDRQHRRKTWGQNVARHALPEDARMQLQVAAGPALRHLLGDVATRPHIGVGGTS